MYLMSLKETVFNYPTKYPQGFTSAEVKELLKKYPKANLKKFNQALGVHTAKVIDKQILTYHNDVLMALTCAIENRNPNVAEFD